ncbi:MAG: hypothetical protein U0232_30020 [Thermomicrobiales bacterium]
MRKHAAARQVVVTLTFLDDTILDVQDDGRGFAPDLLPAPCTPPTAATASGGCASASKRSAAPSRWRAPRRGR